MTVEAAPNVQESACHGAPAHQLGACRTPQATAERLLAHRPSDYESVPNRTSATH